MRKPKRKRKLHSFFLFLFIMIGTLVSFYALDHALYPALQDISHFQGRAVTNQIIDNAVNDTMETMDFSTLLLQGENNSYTANTKIVNQFCRMLSEEITVSFAELPKKQIRIPLGAATKISFLANVGPKVPYTLLPMGAVHVDYDTDFRSVGINQINYKIWLDISLEVKIVNPVFEESVLMERKIMLADLVFGGKVPEHYFQMGSLDEYLLTE